MFMATEEMLTIYTDGGCRPNPGRGGWGYIVVFDDCEIQASGSKDKSTNNRMEMTAVIQALEDHKEYKSFLIYSDSMYVINCAQGKWQRKKNKDLWSIYDKVSEGKSIKWSWVKGHSKDKYNDLVDQLCTEQILNENH